MARYYQYDHPSKCKLVKQYKLKFIDSIIKLINEIDMLWHKNNNDTFQIWNGEYLPLNTNSDNILIYHEVAHWLFASEEERKFANF